MELYWDALVESHNGSCKSCEWKIETTRIRLMLLASVSAR